MSLPTNLKDAILDTTQNTHRRYNVKSTSGDSVVLGDVYFDDITEYEQEGDELPAQMVNDANELINTHNKNFSIHTITVPTSSWTNNSHATYTKKAVISSAKFSATYVPISVDLIPADDSAFFSAGEEDALTMLNPNVEFGNGTVTFYIETVPSVDLKFQIRGEV